MPPFRYFLLDRNKGVKQGSSAWSAFLPTSRHLARGDIEHPAGQFVTCGDYFTAVRAFLEEAPHHRLADAVSARIGRPIVVADLETVDICLEKHGNFYHPARVAVVMDGKVLTFAVNAAFTETGRRLIGDDYKNLRRLTRQCAYPFFPHVSHLGEIRSRSGQQKWRLFLGQWLEGYHEFHLHRITPGAAARMIAWDPLRGSMPLSDNQIGIVYRQAAAILAATYNLVTTEHIGTWHHAAGDFIVRIEPDVDVKLITVRRYKPLLHNPPGDTESIFQALLLFLLKMSVRMRLDRDGGTGDLLWAEEGAVPVTLDGFFEGLSWQVLHQQVPDEIPTLFHSYLKQLTEQELLDLLEAVIRNNMTDAMELGLVCRHLETHARSIRSAI